MTLYGNGAAWTWHVSGQHGTTAGRTGSRLSAIRWVCRVLSYGGDAEAVIEHPYLDQPLHIARRGGVLHADLDGGERN